MYMSVIIKNISAASGYLLQNDVGIISALSPVVSHEFAGSHQRASNLTRNS